MKSIKEPSIVTPNFLDLALNWRIKQLNLKGGEKGRESEREKEGERGER